jgi:RND family efflux transporter MFP subunit
MKVHSIFAGMMIASVIATGCTRAQGREAKPAPPVKVQTVAPAPPATGIRYSATIEPFEQVALAFKTSGYVDDLLRRRGVDGRLRVAQAGDQVSRGTILARVREEDARERVTQGRAKLAEAEASRSKTRLDLDRAEKLFATDSLTKTDLDAARAAFETAESRVMAAKAEIELAQSALRDCTLVAPSTGVLLERKIELGSLVAPGSVGFLLGDVSAVKARFGIPDAMIQGVRLGDPIGVSIDALAATMFAGTVTAIAPVADPQSRVFDVEVTIANKDGHLRPGMIGTVSVDPASLARPAMDRQGREKPRAIQTTLYQPSSIVTVPLSAIVKSDAGTGQYAVLIVEKKGDVEIARLRRVKLGDVMGNGIAVLEGVAVGDRVVVAGATLLTDGETVRVIS